LVSVGEPIAHRLNHMLSGIRAEIALKIYGDDLDTLRNLAESLIALSGFARLSAVAVSLGGEAAAAAPHDRAGCPPATGLPADLPSRAISGFAIVQTRLRLIGLF
jgi:hypothetical protein